MTFKKILSHFSWILILILTQSLQAQALYPVGVVENLTLHDAARNRDVPVKIYYPQATQPQAFPVIIFSHGAGGSKDGYGYYGQFWASHGYICIHPNHAGSDSVLIHRYRPLLTLNAVDNALKDPDNLTNRPLDISFVIDSLPLIASQVPELKGRLDANRIGVAGHSFGAYTSIAVAGAVLHLPNGTTRNFGDKRVKAFIAMSPQSKGHVGLTDGSWDLIFKPVFTLSGTKDKEMHGQAEDRLVAYQNMPAGDKFHLLVEGMNHMEFADVEVWGAKVDPRYHELVESTTLDFWDIYLKGTKTTGGLSAVLKTQGLLQADGTVLYKGLKGTFQSK